MEASYPAKRVEKRIRSKACSLYSFHYKQFLTPLGAVHMSRASPANRADLIISPLMGA